MLKLSKKIALPLIAVLLVITGVGGYFLFKNFKLDIPKYVVDKYPELIDMCDTKESGNALTISCKALMLSIKPDKDTPCLDSLVITNSEELKELTFCESEKTFTWTNDILQFKKLKPIVINLQYTKGLLKYSLNSITFEDISEEYIQGIVNRDIEEIMGMDRSATTIKNSFDFCPRPEILPDYVVKKEEYTKYWKENILKKNDYTNESSYTMDSPSPSIFLGCESQVNLGYIKKCPTVDIKISSDLRNKMKTLAPLEPNWSQNPASQDLPIIKQISLIYDGTGKVLKDFLPLLRIDDREEAFMLIRTQEDMLTFLIGSFSSNKDLNEEVFCSTAKLLQGFPNYTEAQSLLNKIKDTVFQNIEKSSSPLCSSILNPETFDHKGWYIKSIFTKDTDVFSLFNKCINLQGYLNEK